MSGQGICVLRDGVWMMSATMIVGHVGVMAMLVLMTMRVVHIKIQGGGGGRMRNI